MAILELFHLIFGVYIVGHYLVEDIKMWHLLIGSRCPALAYAADMTISFTPITALWKMYCYYPIFHMRKLRLKDAKSINIEIKEEQKEQRGDWWTTVYKTVPVF